jgi:DNA-binding NarL/FixJ family response regulator
MVRGLTDIVSGKAPVWLARSAARVWQISARSTSLWTEVSVLLVPCPVADSARLLPPLPSAPEPPPRAVTLMPARQPTGAAITCVVADVQPARVEAISDLLSSHGIEVVARASSMAAALAAIDAHSPTVAVLDLATPRLGGIEVARLARERSPDTATILYTGGEARELELLAAVDAGVRGFVRKEGAPDVLIRAVELAASGAIYVDPALAALVRAGVTPPVIHLSARERDILRLLADGKTNDEIGRALHISEHTVRTYLRRAMKKLEAGNRTQAVATALRESLIV